MRPSLAARSSQFISSFNRVELRRLRGSLFAEARTVCREHGGGIGRGELRVSVLTELVCMAKRAGELRPRGHGGRPVREAWFVHEQALIGSVLVLGRNNKNSQRWLKALTGWDFGEPIHRWLWSQLRKGELTADTARECREKFKVALVAVAAKCLKEELWWWGDWYVSEIKEEAVKRSVET